MAGRMWRLWGSLARRPALAVCFVAVFSFFSNFAVSRIIGMPQPRVHDEFSYLLAGDTFAHGRLTNPTHPLWRHFETLHVLHQPTYMSKYPPGQGLMLAAGQAFLGHPAFGVWLEVAIMAAAVAWMLYAWVPPRWAVLGGFLAAFHFGFTNYWSHSYWGGALPAFGGALVWGALRRLLGGRAVVRSSLLFGAGLSVLACTRPYEGLVSSLPAGLLLLISFFRNSNRSPALLLPAFLMAGLAAGGLAFYNRAVTGNPWTMPLTVYEDQYSTAPIFIWQKPRPSPVFRSKIMEEYDRQYSRRWFDRRRSVPESPENFFTTIGVFWSKAAFFYFTPLLWIPFLAAFFRLGRDRWLLFIFACVFLPLILAIAVTGTFSQYHYYAPVAGLFMLFVCEGLRYLRAIRIPGPYRKYRNAVILAFAAGVLLLNAKSVFEPVSFPRPVPRTPVEEELMKTPGPHLVLVRYAPDHWVHQEWVYNGADIDASPVVWAREQGGGADGELLEYYPDRHVWILEADLNPFRLEHVRSPRTKAPG